MKFTIKAGANYSNVLRSGNTIYVAHAIASDNDHAATITIMGGASQDTDDMVTLGRTVDASSTPMCSHYVGAGFTAPFVCLYTATPPSADLEVHFVGII